MSKFIRKAFVVNHQAIRKGVRVVHWKDITGRQYFTPTEEALLCDRFEHFNLGDVPGAAIIEEGKGWVVVRPCSFIAQEGTHRFLVEFTQTTRLDRVSGGNVHCLPTWAVRRWYKSAPG
jgi:hypothetical protein